MCGWICIRFNVFQARGHRLRQHVVAAAASSHVTECPSGAYSNQPLGATRGWGNWWVNRRWTAQGPRICQLFGRESHRIHGAAIYCNIYHPYTPNVSIYHTWIRHGNVIPSWKSGFVQDMCCPWICDWYGCAWCLGGCLCLIFYSTIPYWVWVKARYPKNWMVNTTNRPKSMVPWALNFDFGPFQYVDLLMLIRITDCIALFAHSEQRIWKHPTIDYQLSNFWICSTLNW